MIKLEGLREASRFINARAEAMVASADFLLNNEIRGLRHGIAARFTGADAELGQHVKVEQQGNYVVIILPFHVGLNRKNRQKSSARKSHNPYWSQFANQPFQDELVARGYTDIDPAPGHPIEPSGSKAPGVRIKARLPEELLRRIKGL